MRAMLAHQSLRLQQSGTRLDAWSVLPRGMVAPVVLVAVGGACGAVLRWSVAPSPDAEGVPWGTLGVNLLGSLLLAP